LELEFLFRISDAVQSSTYLIIGYVLLMVVIAARALFIAIKSMEPSLVPCGTPADLGSHLEKQSASLTLC
jgi:hypothetical protein